MEVQREPFWQYSSFFAIRAQPLNQYPPATKKAYKRKNGKNPEEEIKREQEESVDSSEITISCEFSSETKKPRTSETSSTATSSTEKEPLVNATVELKKNYSNEKVSTELTLFDESWITKKRDNMEESAHNSAYTSRTKEPLSKEALEVELNNIVVAHRISAMKYYSPKEEEEERRMGVSTKLKLYEDPFKIKKTLTGSDDPFKIKKTLTGSDLGNLCRLLVNKSMVKEHILPYLSIDCLNEIESDKGARFTVWDQDTKSVHQLIFKRWLTSKSYVFIDKWSKDFVRRRDLKKGDEIGFYWDPYCSRFNFCVLKRAPRNN